MKKSITKKLFLALLTFSLITPPGSVVADSIPDEQFTIAPPTAQEDVDGILIQDSQFIRNKFATLQAFTADGTTAGVSKITGIYNCNRYGDTNCDKDKYFMYTAPLGMCDIKLVSNCVQEIFAQNESGVDLPINYLREFPGKTVYEFEGNAGVNLPSGGSTFVVDIPSAPHKGGTNYLISASMEGVKEFGDTNFTLRGMAVGIFAISINPDDQTPASPPKYAPGLSPLGVPQYFPAGSNLTKLPSNCVQSTRNLCALSWPIPDNIRFGIKLKLSTKISGWLHGRLVSPTASLSSDKEGDQILEIRGYSSLVPLIYGWLPKSKFTNEINKYYAMYPFMKNVGSNFTKSANDARVFLHDSNEYTSRNLQEAVAWLVALKDKASYAPTAWSIRTMETGVHGIKVNPCFSKNDYVSGLVSTNASSYIAGPPEFNQYDQSLDYKVAAPHFLPNGEVFQGTYTLNIKSDVARCLYGFNSAPISAKVSIVSTAGNTTVATTTLNEKNGWITLTANGFTFSDPTIKVKLTQEKVLAKKKITISCINGKSTKKVTGISPKCPSGFKVK
jgi:hypothetical protein